MHLNLRRDIESKGLLGKKDRAAWQVRDDTGTLHIGNISPQNLQSVVSNENKVFIRRAELKMAVSQIAMHLSQMLRDGLFAEIDFLYDGNSYEEGEDAPIGVSSFRAFLRFMIFNEITVAPLLGVSDEGHLLAAWSENKNKYYFEFLTDDSIRLNYSIDHPDSEPTVTSSSGKSQYIMRDILPNKKFTAWLKE